MTPILRDPDTAQQTAAAAQSTGTYGFNAGLQLDIDANKSEETIKETTSLASNITGDNIHIQTGVGQATAAGTNTTIQGSNLIARDALSINTGSLDVLASRDTLEVDSKSEQASISAQMTVYGASGGASLSGSYSRSKSGESHTTYNNSTLLADNMTLNTTDDMTIRGGNVRADTALNANIGGNLTVESVQNRSRTENNSMGVSGGISFGGTEDSKKDSVTNSAGQTVSNTRGQGASDIAGLAGANGGINASNGMSVTKETVRSSLTSGGTANITVGGITQITGATIGTTDDEGNDLGNLNLTTSELRFTDLRDTHVSSQTSGSISTSVSIGGASATELEQGQTLAEDGKGRDMTVNTTNITYSNASEYDASNAMATLGTGNITVGGVALEQDGELTEAGAAEGSALAGLNRDTANTTNELWSIDRQEGDVDLVIDHAQVGRAIKKIGEGVNALGDKWDQVKIDMGLKTIKIEGADEMGQQLTAQLSQAQLDQLSKEYGDNWQAGASASMDKDGKLVSINVDDQLTIFDPQVQEQLLAQYTESGVKIDEVLAQGEAQDQATRDYEAQLEEDTYNRFMDAQGESSANFNALDAKIRDGFLVDNSGGYSNYSVTLGEGAFSYNPSVYTGTQAVSFNMNVGALGVGGTVGYNYIWDYEGNSGIQYVVGGGGDTGSFSFMVNHEMTTAPSIFETTGFGSQAGVDIGAGPSVEYGVMTGKGYTGTYTGGGLDLFPLPGGVSGLVTYTDWVMYREKKDNRNDN